MNNDVTIMIGGRKVPVGQVKHWRLAPEDFVPNRSQGEMFQWGILLGVKDAWERLDPSIFMRVLSPHFTYGSYWVHDSTLDRAAYQDYIRGKFNTIRKAGSIPSMNVVVLYEGLAPASFCYALRMRQGGVETLLTFKFDEYGLASLYMTDPQIFTFEPTFAKGGVVGEDGEPRVFRHSCSPEQKGRMMSAQQLQEFAVECVELLLRESGSRVECSFKSTYKEFPNIVTKSGPDTFYHRIDVSLPEEGNPVSSKKMDEFLAAAKVNNAWAMAMPIALFCTETNGTRPLCGGRFFMKAMESRRIG